MTFPVLPNASSCVGLERTEPILSVQQMKDRYLFGISLKDQEGNEMPDETLRHHINAAISYWEHKLDIVIQKTQFIERYDYRQIDYTNFNFIQLKKKPVNELTILKAKFPQNRELVNYPEQWFVVEKEAGQIQLAPVEGSFSGLIVLQGGSYLPLIYGTQQYWPHLFEATYIAGFDDDKIPVIINEMIGMQASIRIFEIMGDLIFGPGISSESVNLDAASVSKTGTASTIYSGFAARVEGYKNQVKEYSDVVRKYYQGFSFVIP